MREFEELKYPYSLPPLPYSYDALDPYIDQETMNLHHTKHHQAYIDNLNKALENYPEFQNLNLKELLEQANSLPEEIKQKVINHGGGHANHTFFWPIMTPNSREPQGILREDIEKTFGSFEKFKEEFFNSALSLFGSGWTWLVLTPSKELKIKNTPNQNSPLMDKEIPIIGIDLWEHAYYLKYRNKRAEYIQNWWEIVNWERAEKIYQNSL